MPDARLSPPGPISPSATAMRPEPACTAAAIIGPVASWRTPTKRTACCCDKRMHQRRELAADDAEGEGHLLGRQHAHQGLGASQSKHGVSPPR